MKKVQTLVPLLLLAACTVESSEAPALATEESAPAPGESPSGEAPGLRDPSLATETAPDTFRVRFETTEGPFVVQVNRAWAPNGADRFYNLVKVGFFNDLAFFRNIDGFMCQFGIHGDPEVSRPWFTARIQDDPVAQPNKRGRITFATAGPNTRTTQLFINKVNNGMLDSMGFSPFGEVVDGMQVVDALYSGYGEGAPQGRGPAQNRIQLEGNAYLKEDFPELDYITSATILE